MSEIRTWEVQSPSFHPPFGISGATLVEAIRKNFERIGLDARMGPPSSYRLASLAAKFQPRILAGHGGVELTVDYVPLASGRPLGRKTVVVWIHASGADLPEPVDLVPGASRQDA